MATPKVQKHARPKRLRIPSNEELERMQILWQYGRAQTMAKKHGLIEALLPPEFRIRRPAAKSEQEENDKVARRVDEIIEERVKARLTAQGIPYTEERPYRSWGRQSPSGKGAAPTREREVRDPAT